MNLNLANDPQVWDDVENIALVADFAPQDGQSVAAGVAGAVRRAPSYKELAASNGAYTGQDLVWLLPAVNVSTNPKPGDQVVAGQTVWTVLEAALEAVQSVWRLVTRNMVIAWQLRDTIDIQQSGLTYDADRAAVRSWPSGSALVGGTVLYAALAARVQPTDAEVGYGRGIRAQDLRLTLFLSQQVVLDVRECRVKWTDVLGFAGPPNTVYYLDLLHYRNAQRIDELPQLEAMLKK